MIRADCAVLSLALSLNLCVVAIADQVEFMADGNRIVIEVPEGLMAMRQTDLAEFYRWTDAIVGETRILHEALVTRTGDQWQPMGRKIQVATMPQFARVFYRPADWRDLRERYLEWIESEPDMYPLGSVEDLKDLAGAILNLSRLEGTAPSELSFTDEPNAVASLLFSGDSANEVDIEDRNSARFCLVTLQMMVNGVPMLFYISSNPIVESNLVEECEWLIGTANFFVESTTDLNAHPFGDFQRTQIKLERERPSLYRSLLLLIWTILATVYLSYRPVRKKARHARKKAHPASPKS